MLRTNGAAAERRGATAPTGARRAAAAGTRRRFRGSPRRAARRLRPRRSDAARETEDAQPRDEGPVHRTLIRAHAAADRKRRARPGRFPPSPFAKPPPLPSSAASVPSAALAVRPFGDGFGNQGGGFKNPQFSAQPGRGQHRTTTGPAQSRQPAAPRRRPGGAPGGAPGGHGGRRNNQRRGNKGPR